VIPLFCTLTLAVIKQRRAGARERLMKFTADGMGTQDSRVSVVRDHVTREMNGGSSGGRTERRQGVNSETPATEILTEGLFEIHTASITPSLQKSTPQPVLHTNVATRLAYPRGSTWAPNKRRAIFTVLSRLDVGVDVYARSHTRARKYLEPKACRDQK